MKLSTLISALPDRITQGDLDVSITGISVDNRTVELGHVFIAVKGESVDGHQFIPQAIEGGAVAVIAESPAPHDCGISWVQVKDSKASVGSLASVFYGHPSKKLRIAGVTGTNGKTTTTFLLHHVMTSVWRRAGLIGTIAFNDGEVEQDASHTTPAAEKVQELLAAMVDNGCRGASMEVSSHGIDQGRIAGVQFGAAVFTNLSQDHLDYHSSIDEYFGVKKSLFEKVSGQLCDRKPAAVINLDDPRGEELVDEFKDRLYILSYGCGVHAALRAQQIRYSFYGTQFELSYKDKRFLVRTPLIGHFNVLNVLATLGAAIGLGIKPREAIRALESAPQVPGRLELVEKFEGVAVFVDYAHTPDALVNVCRTLRGLEPGRLITVFGCGGDRDKSKRAPMAKAASDASDLLVATSDNPRTEDPVEILEDVKKGLGGTPYEVIVDRAEAIQLAISTAKPGDIVLVAGKGHEPYQEIDGVRHEFDDRKAVRNSVEIAKAAMAQKRRERDAEKEAKREEWAKRKAEEEGGGEE